MDGQLVQQKTWKGHPPVATVILYWLFVSLSVIIYNLHLQSHINLIPGTRSLFLSLWADIYTKVSIHTTKSAVHCVLPTVYHFMSFREEKQHAATEIVRPIFGVPILVSLLLMSLADSLVSFSLSLSPSFPYFLFGVGVEPRALHTLGSTLPSCSRTNPAVTSLFTCSFAAT